MALQKDITLDSGINLPESYMKITSLVDVCGIHTTINVGIYKDKTSRLDGKKIIVKFKHTCVGEYQTYFGQTTLKQEDVTQLSSAYEWLKTLPFYSGATDVMDVKE